MTALKKEEKRFFLDYKLGIDVVDVIFPQVVVEKGTHGSELKHQRTLLDLSCTGPAEAETHGISQSSYYFCSIVHVLWFPLWLSRK